MVGTFYRESTHNRALQFPPVTSGVGGRVSHANGSPYPSIHVYACPTIPGQCGYAQTGEDGTYRRTIGSYRLQFGRTNDGAHPDGFYRTGGFTADFDQASVRQLRSYFLWPVIGSREAMTICRVQPIGRKAIALRQPDGMRHAVSGRSFRPRAGIPRRRASPTDGPDPGARGAGSRARRVPRARSRAVPRSI